MEKDFANIFRQDCSLKKAEGSLKSKQKKVSTVICAKNKQIGRFELKNLLTHHLKENAQLRLFINTQKLSQLNLQFYDEPATIKIQSHIRGYLCRQNYEKVIETQLIIEKYEKKSKEALALMVQEVKNQIISGDSTGPAAVLIQKNLKIFNWRRKLKRLKFIFENYYLQSSQHFLAVFQSFLEHWASKKKVLNLKFLKYRGKRLREIREKLAILTIKKAIYSRKFNIAIGRQLYKRVIRRRTRLNSKSSDLHESPPQDLMSLLNQLEDSSISSAEERRRHKMLNLSKIVYNVKNTEEVIYVPLLERPNFQVTDTILVKKLEKIEQFETAKYRSLTIATPPLATLKRFYQNAEAPQKLMLLPPRALPQQRPMTSKPKPVSLDMNFLKPTQIYLRKPSLQTEAKIPAKKVRPPSRRILRSTISSLSKKSHKKPRSVTRGKISFKQDLTSTSRALKKNWKSEDMSDSFFQA